MKSSRLCALLVGSLMLLAALSPALAVAGPVMAPGMSTEGINGSSWYSTNWSGYAVTGSTGSVTYVNGSWTVPTVTAVTGTPTAYSAFWVGIDGFSSNTVEQTGTLSYTVGGKVQTPYAWYEFYPAAMVQITTGTLGAFKVSPGDEMYASVTYSSGNKFTVFIEDTTTGNSFSTTGTVNGAARSSAEWIAEAPSSNRGVLPLANFGTVNLGQDYTSVMGTCCATINGVSDPIGLFSSSAIQTITMATETYNFRTRSYTIVPKAVPTLLSTDGTTFSVTWASAGQDAPGFGPF